MSNPNYIPIGPNQKIFGGRPSITQESSLPNANFVDAMGKPIERQVASGACTKCGFVGHLPFQCRNTMPIEIGGILRDPLKTEKASSESDFETPLQREDRKIREREAKRLKKQLKKMAKKQKKEAKKKETKKRRRNSSSSSSSSDTTSKNQKKHKKNRESKKKRHRERHSSKSSSSSD